MQDQISSAIAGLRKPFPLVVLISVLALFFSFVGFLLPIFREAVFFIILAAVLVLSFRRLEYGLYAALAELILGSKGYLFYFDFGDFNVSLRIGIFLVVFGVFLARFLIRKFYSPSEPKGRVEGFKGGNSLLSKKELFWFIPFFTAVVIGFGQGLLRDFGFQNVFLDANGYFYLLYLFPFLAVFRDKDKFNKITDILLSSGIVLAIFSLFLFYIFSHELFKTDLIYGWLRNNLLFEITYTGSVFRIFAQSQIFLLVVFFLSLSCFVRFRICSISGIPRIPEIEQRESSRFPKSNKVGSGCVLRERMYLVVVALFFSLTGILVSLSRSFFVGFLAGVFVFLFFVFLKQKKEFGKIILAMILICAASVAFLWTIEPQEPYALIGRAASIKPSAIKTEPASFTRQEELNPLFLEIIKKPFLGWGFGKTVEFLTRDPRALATLPQCAGKESCLYKTYAFEWGYLDLWLKLGLFGLVSLFGILYSSFKKGLEEFKKGDSNSFWILSSLVAFAVTNIFSPYLNHPLGFGFLIISVIGLFASGIEKR